jgi:hypothetical protein
MTMAMADQQYYQSSGTNPWIECFLHGEFIFERRFLVYCLGYIIVSFIGNWCHRSHNAGIAKANANATTSSAPDPKSWKALIASRPTVIAATIHAVATSIIAVGVLFAYYTNPNNNADSASSSSSPWMYHDNINLIHIWQRVGLPISLSYFVIDSYFYCLPKKDVIIFVHHCIMCFCHYPVCHLAGAILAGAGDVEWVTWLSLVGYTSEVSTTMMNYRWYLINTLENDWIGFGIVNGFVVASWAGRVVLFTYLLVVEIYPRMYMYMEQQQMFTFVMMVLGHAGIGLLSLYWCIIMCKGGIKSLFVFKKPQNQKNANGGVQRGLSFAEEVSGKRLDNGTESCHHNSPLKIIEEEAEAYKDGSLFTETPSEKRRSKKIQ